MHTYLTFCLYVAIFFAIVTFALRMIGLNSLKAAVKDAKASDANLLGLILIVAVMLAILPGAIYLQIKGMFAIGMPQWLVIGGIALGLMTSLADHFHKVKQDGGREAAVSVVTCWLMYLGLNA